MKALNSKELNPIKQRQAMVRRLERRIACEGKMSFPAVPAMADDYCERCDQLFAALGRKLTDSQRNQLLKNLASQLDVAFTQSQRSSISVTYSANVGGVLNYFISPQYATVEQAYDQWTSTREPPYFGIEPDAKVLDLVSRLPEPQNCRILDIGAGTGRNALALARRGYLVDAVEMSPKFADILSEAVSKEALNVNIIRENVLEAKDKLNGQYDLIFLSEVVSDFRSVEQLRALFELVASHLLRSGKLLLNAFLTQSNYCGDDAAREFGQLAYTSFFTLQELSDAMATLPLELVANESVHDYEKAHLPSDAWPPTTWYEAWASGLDVFNTSRQDSPIELRWLTFKHI